MTACKTGSPSECPNVPSEDEILTQEDVITLALIRKAMEGDVAAYKALLDSGYGTAKDTVDINTNNAGFDFDEMMKKLSNNAKS